MFGGDFINNIIAKVPVYGESMVISQIEPPKPVIIPIPKFGGLGEAIATPVSFDQNPKEILINLLRTTGIPDETLEIYFFHSDLAEKAMYEIEHPGTFPNAVTDFVEGARTFDYDPLLNQYLARDLRDIKPVYLMKLTSTLNRDQKAKLLKRLANNYQGTSLQDILKEYGISLPNDAFNVNVYYTEQALPSPSLLDSLLKKEITPALPPPPPIPKDSIGGDIINEKPKIPPYLIAGGIAGAAIIAYFVLMKR